MRKQISVTAVFVFLVLAVSPLVAQRHVDARIAAVENGLSDAGAPAGSASSARIAQQRLIESMLLAGMAGGAAMVVAVLLSAIFAGTEFSAIGVIERIPLDGRAVGVTSAVAFVSGLLFGVVPAVVAGRINFAATLQSVTRSVTDRTHVRKAISVLQFAAATTLLIATLLMHGTV